ncbi:MAG: hypothetical protein ACPG32_10890 [Akkermansiaceae bacterium]
MGLFSFFTSANNRHETPAQPLSIDLGTFLFGSTNLGDIPSHADFFSKPLSQKDVYQASSHGFEMGVKNNRLDYVHVTMESFIGKLLQHDRLLDITTATTEKQILQQFGEPYWTDRSDGEAILFYEHSNGNTELQFEFADGKHLSHITISRNGVMSCPDNRASYKVTKPWPPE